MYSSAFFVRLYNTRNICQITIQNGIVPNCCHEQTREGQFCCMLFDDCRVSWTPEPGPILRVPLNNVWKQHYLQRPFRFQHNPNLSDIRSWHSSVLASSANPGSGYV